MIARQKKRAGFTLTEMAIVGGMMGFLAILLNSVWSGLAQPSIDTMVRCMIEQEAQLAAMHLAFDCGGCPPMKTSTISGPQNDNICTGISASSGGSELIISFTDETITYRVDTDKHNLVRDSTIDSTTDSMVVASNVYDMTLNDTDEPGDDQSDEGWIKVNLTFQMTEHTSSDNGYKYKPYKYVLYVPESIP